jgi:hypothetical protein
MALTDVRPPGAVKVAFYGVRPPLAVKVGKD